MPLYYRFFHILFVDSDNDKFVTGVEVPPSTHRRPQQRPRCVCGAPAPAAQNFAYNLRAALLHACHTQAMQPCAPPAPPRIILSTSHLFRTRTSAVAPWAAACTHHHHRSHTARRPFGRRWSSWTFVIPSRRDLDADAITFCSTCRFCFPISGERCALWLRRDGHLSQSREGETHRIAARRPSCPKFSPGSRRVLSQEVVGG